MPEITQKRISEILRIAFDLLWFEPQGLYLREILEHIDRHCDLTSEERSAFTFAPQFPRYEVIIRIGSIPLARAGWLVKTKRGKWQITEQGRIESKRFSNAEDFFTNAIQEYEGWKEREAARKGGLDYLVVDRAEERAREQIHRFLESMPPAEMRSLVGELLRGLGYYIVWTAPIDQQDGPVHVVARANPLGITGGQVMVHINRAGQAATAEGLRSFMSILGTEDHGLYVSLGGFTSHVMQEVYVRPHSNVRLIDQDEFIELWLGTLNKLSADARKRLPLKPVYFLAPPEI
jgi:restriction system protein